MSENKGTIELRDMKDIDFGYSEEEALEHEELYEEKGGLHAFKKKCRKCGDTMLNTRVENFYVPSYMHMFSGSRDSGTMPVDVCHYCLRDGWRPYEVRANNNEVHWENVFKKSNPKLKENMDRIKDECIEKFEERSERHKHDADITQYMVTPEDIGENNLIEHLKEEYNELIEVIERNDYEDIEDESRDVVGMSALINWWAKDKKNEKKDGE